jgi:hypothetical protein
MDGVGDGNRNHSQSGNKALNGDNFRVGYEDTATGTDLIVWLKMKSSDTVKFSLSPKSPVPEKKL